MNNYREQDLKGRELFSKEVGEYYITAGTEDEFDVIDIYATARTKSERIYSIEIKLYNNPQHARNYSDYTVDGKDYGFQIDEAKLDALMDKYYEENRIPILYCIFNDYIIAWDIRKIDYKKRVKKVWTTKSGMNNYGKEKELTSQTYLYKNEAKYIKKKIDD